MSSFEYLHYVLVDRTAGLGCQKKQGRSQTGYGGRTCSREWIDRRIGIGNDAGVVPEAVAAVVAVAVAVAAAAVAIGGEEEEIEEEEKSLECQSMGY
ncbi:unnamed protein product [Rhizophagus irregularis]|nr:unnamed protein product [Rhizophagus irregularis]